MKKINLLSDIADTDKIIKSKFQIFSEIRNKFAHVFSVSTFKNLCELDIEYKKSCKKLLDWYIEEEYTKDNEGLPENEIVFIASYYNGSHPDTVGNQWGSDQNARRSIYTETLKNSNMLPRFMTVHEGLGNTLIELNRNGHTKTNMQLTPATLNSINKIHYDNAK